MSTPGSEHESSFVAVSEPASDLDNVESTPYSLSRAVYARRAEYTRLHTMRIKVGTWNVAACPGVEKDIKGWFVDGKGVDTKLAKLNIADSSHDNIEAVTAQEARRSRNRSTLPLGDEGTVIGGEHIGLYVLGLQEIVTLASAKEYIGKVYIDNGPLSKWKETLAEAVPEGYELVADTQMSGLLLLIYASPSIAPTISSVSSACVGTGVMGYLGNKGAVSTRIVLGETTRLVFINSHLASGTDNAHIERRCWDFNQILSRTYFEPISRAGVLDDAQEGIGDEDFAFWFGDLNFRLEGLPGDDIRRLLMLHTKGEYDVGSKARSNLENELTNTDKPIIIHHVESDEDEPLTPRTGSSRTSSDEDSTDIPDPDDFVQDPHTDPTSLQATLDSLLPHDQLRRIQRQKMAFHDGWREGPITFLPTYKYDVGSFGTFDSSEKKRPPSWCDRILFRTRRDRVEYEGKSQQEELARLKDEEMRSRGIVEAAQAEEVIFDYDPSTDGADGIDYYDEYDEGEEEAEDVVTEEGYIDNLHLDLYTSHQRVLSSDHKPLDAVFTLHYDAVVPELKSKVHQEVARELDRAENEHRPAITILVDHPPAVEGNAAPTTTNAAEGVNFGNVGYLQRKECALTIANTGQVPAKFAFISRPVETGQPDQIKPSWLNVTFMDSYDHNGAAKILEDGVTLEPGETIMATLEIYVEDFAQVRALNRGELLLDDVLVLRVTDGRDYFVPIRANWKQSCFGRSVDELIRIPEGGVRALLPPRHGKGGPVNRGQEVCWSAPRELFKLTEAIESLMERAIADRDMIEEFQGHTPDGWPFEAITEAKSRETNRCYLLEALDSDMNLTDSFPPEVQAVEKLEILSETLLLFLGSITDGIIPPTLWEKLEQEMMSRRQPISAEETRTWVLDVLSASPNHSISLVFLMAMLGKVLTELAPVSQSRASSSAESKKSRVGFRQSMGYGKSRRSMSIDDPAVMKRQTIQRRFAEIFAAVVIRGPSTLADKERRASDQRRREILEAFLVKE